MAQDKMITLQRVPLRILSVLTVFASSMQAVNVSAQERSSLSVDSIMSVWTERERAATTLECTWLSKKFTRGDFAAALGAGPRSDKSVPRDVIGDTYVRFVFDRTGGTGRMRFRLEHGAWSAGKRSLLDNGKVVVFDGAVERCFFPSDAHRFPSAFVGSSSLRSSGRNLQLLPLILAICPLDPDIGIFDSGKYRLTGARAAVRGRPVIVLGVDQNEIWVDPAMDCLPVRYLQRESDKNVFLVEMSYVRNQGVGWTPETWKITTFDGPGAILESESAKVTRFALNEPVKDAEFQVDFPIGTFVTDGLTRQKYIVRANHQRRLVLPGEYNGRNYHELLTTDPPRQGQSRWRAWLVWLSITVLLSVVAIMGYRKWHNAQRVVH